jgi:hypothetical protein
MKQIKAYLLNQRALVVSEMAKLTKDGQMNFVQMELSTRKYNVIEELLRELNIKQPNEKKEKN